MDATVSAPIINTDSLAPSTTAVPVSKKHGYFAVDIECTGASLFTDKCFAIGLAYGDSLSSVKTFNACVTLGKPSAVSWSQYWKEMGFEMACYERFWSKNKQTLNLLQDPTKVNLYETEKKMIDALNAFMVDMEKEFDQLCLVTDTTCFDTVWLTYLLQKHGHPGLAYFRNGEYRRGGSFEMDSFRLGVYGVNPRSSYAPWRQDKDFAVNLTSPHDHHPEHDALYIYQKWFATLEANDRINQAARIKK